MEFKVCFVTFTNMAQHVLSQLTARFVTPVEDVRVSGAGRLLQDDEEVTFVA
jgi:hypothetical protein